MWGGWACISGGGCRRPCGLCESVGDVPNFGQADTITGVRVYDINGALAGQQSISLKRTSLNVALLRFTFPLIETEE